MKKFFALVMSVIMILASSGIAAAEQEARAFIRELYHL